MEKIAIWGFCCAPLLNDGAVGQAARASATVRPRPKQRSALAVSLSPQGPPWAQAGKTSSTG